MHWQPRVRAENHSTRNLSRGEDHRRRDEGQQSHLLEYSVAEAAPMASAAMPTKPAVASVTPITPLGSGRRPGMPHILSRTR